ncbi:winged helix-turn-helix domain-containing protein [Patescibacteria group bacterium]|nr:winged helix-turn-helix domain-containing protein [Patescibacteria group bacterium]
MTQNYKQNVGKQLEKHFKGVSNHWRINILLLLNEESGLSLEQIAETLNANYKTISEHTKKLVHAGLINKKYINNTVSHSLSPYGKKFINFFKTF